MSILEKLPKIRGNYRQNVQLKNWFNVGGKAEVIFKPADIEDLAYFFKNCPKDISINVVGAASNIIVRDEGVKGVVVRLGGEFAKISKDGELITAGASALCANVALFSKNQALTNLEFLTGIPGSIGGAIAMNAGCYGSDISQILVNAKAIDFEGNLHEFVNEDLGLTYRKNKIAKDFIFVSGIFKAEKSTAEEVLDKINECNLQREKTQPIRVKTGGSTFKNPNSNDPSAKKAWKLIDEAGCRGLSVGDAKISEKHCNFMINNGNASADDLIALVDEVKRRVLEKSGTNLEMEIKII